MSPDPVVISPIKERMAIISLRPSKGVVGMAPFIFSKVDKDLVLVKKNMSLVPVRNFKGGVAFQSWGRGHGVSVCKF